MDNREIHIQSEGQKDFEAALKLISSSNKTLGYQVKDNTLILFRYKSEKMIAFPYEMPIEELIVFAWGWLQANNPSDGKPDHDGDNEKGFLIYNESWGHVNGDWQAYAGIKPIWAMYGK